MKIGQKIIILIECLVMLSILTIGIFSYYLGTEIIHERIEAQMESVTILKANYLNNFILERKNDMVSVGNQCDKLLQNNNDTDFNELRECLHDRVQENNFFIELFIMNQDGAVIISTDQTQEGKIKTNEPYFINGQKNITVQSFYYDFSLQYPAMTVALPLIDEQKKTINVVAGRVNLTEVSNIFTERSGLGETGETYLVNTFNLAVTELRKENIGILKKTIYSEAVVKALKEKPMTVQFAHDYPDYSGEKVHGAYLFISGLSVCIITEINQNEVFALMTKFYTNLLFISLFTLGITVVIGYFSSKTLTKSITALSKATQKIGKGDFDFQIAVTSKDEIGELGKSFESMKQSLKQTQMKLLDSQNYLEQRVEERTEELQQKIDELKNYKRLTIDRELKMVEMKKKLEEMSSKQNGGV